MTIYCGVDFHVRQQTVCYGGTADRQVQLRELHDEGDDISGFYSHLAGEVIVGIDASGYSAWFEQSFADMGHHVWLGDTAEICRRAMRRQNTALSHGCGDESLTSPSKR